MSDPLTGPVLLRVGSALVAGQAKRLLSKPFALWRTAWGASREARKSGIRVSMMPLFGWLRRSDVRGYLISATVADLSNSLDSLALLIDAPEQEQREQALRLLEIVSFALVSSQSGPTSTAIADARGRAATHSEGAATREAIARLEEKFDSRSTPLQVFEEDVKSLHPWRRARCSDHGR